MCQSTFSYNLAAGLSLISALISWNTDINDIQHRIDRTMCARLACQPLYNHQFDVIVFGDMNHGGDGNG